MSVSGAHGDTIGFYSFRLYRNAMKCIGIGTLYRTSVEVEKIWTFLVCNGEREHHTLKQKWNLLVSTWPQEFVVVFVVCTFSNVTKATAAGSDEILSSDMRNEQESESVKEPNRTNGGKRQERDGQKLLSTLFKNRNYVIWNLVTKLWNSVINADEREKWTQTLPIYFCLIYLDFIFRKGPHPTFPHFSISFLWFVCFLYHAPCGLERNKERERDIHNFNRLNLVVLFSFGSLVLCPIFIVSQRKKPKMFGDLFTFSFSISVAMGCLYHS